MMKQTTVKELIDFLKDNFSIDDKLCYWHEGGAWMDCEHLYKSELGHAVLHTVKQDKDDRREYIDDNEMNDEYRKVNDSDIIIY